MQPSSPGMTSAIHSRATGRSGPKTKTGCTTCRRRKVRCDETRPVCANCTRLRLPCGFLDPPGPASQAGSQRDSRRARSTSQPQLHQGRRRQVGLGFIPSSDQAGPPLTSPADPGQGPPGTELSGEPPPRLTAMPGHPASATASLTPASTTTSPVDSGGDRYYGMLGDGFVPQTERIGSGSWPPHWDLEVREGPRANAIAGGLAIASPFQDVFFSSINLSDLDLSYGSTNELLFGGTSASAGWQAPLGRSQNKKTDRPDEETEAQLLEHFTKATNPISVILPTHTEWTAACRGLLAMARNSSCLSSAIYALSAMHIYTSYKAPEMLEMAQGYYQASSTQVNAIFDRYQQPHDASYTSSSGATGASGAGALELKQAFATLFLLSHVEVTAQSTTWASEWPLQHVRTAHARVREHSDRIQTWAGTTRRLLTWMALLQAKAEYNGGTPAVASSGELERCSTESSTLVGSTGDPFGRPEEIGRHGQGQQGSGHGCAADSERTDSEMDDPRTPSELACDTVNQPALDFHLRAQSFTPRIIALDKYHHRRGTLETEFEILKAGHVINTDLHALWAARPATFSFLMDPASLSCVFQPAFAGVVVRNLRVYGANFWAQFIYLHRVAFVAYPATEDVTRAVGEIVRLAADLQRDAEKGWQRGPVLPGQEESSAGQSPHDGDEDRHLPHTMLWPLFMAGLECPLDDRAWVLQTMRQIRGLPNSEKAVVLLEEVLRRQDESKVRIDHRDVRKELFDSELSVVY